MKLVWHEVSTPPGSWAAKAHGVHLFTAKKHNEGYRLHTKLKNVTRNGKIQFCASMFEAKQVAEKILREYMKSNDEIKLHERRRR